MILNFLEKKQLLVEYVKYALFSNEDKKAFEFYRNHKDQLSSSIEADFLKNLINLKMQAYSEHEAAELSVRFGFPKRSMEREESKLDFLLTKKSLGEFLMNECI